MGNSQKAQKPFSTQTSDTTRPTRQYSPLLRKGNKIQAKYLSEQVWKPNNDPLPNLDQIRPTIPINLSPFSYSELSKVISNITVGKAPGPDKDPPEYWKWASTEFKLRTLDLLNKCYQSASAPKQWLRANVAAIYKGSANDPSLPASYRPISLCNILYKIYAALIKTDLLHSLINTLDPHNLGSEHQDPPLNPYILSAELLNPSHKLPPRSTWSFSTGHKHSTPSHIKH